MRQVSSPVILVFPRLGPLEWADLSCAPADEVMVLLAAWTGCVNFWFMKSRKKKKLAYTYPDRTPELRSPLRLYGRFFAGVFGWGFGSSFLATKTKIVKCCFSLQRS